MIARTAFVLLAVMLLSGAAFVAQADAQRAVREFAQTADAAVATGNRAEPGGAWHRASAQFTDVAPRPAGK